jgi:hypothetical protein
MQSETSSTAAPTSQNGAGNGIRPNLKIIAAIVVIVAVLFAVYIAMNRGNEGGSGYAKLAVELATGKKIPLSGVFGLLNISGVPFGGVNTVKMTAPPSNVSYLGGGEYSVSYSGVNVAVPFTYRLATLSNGSYSKVFVDLGVFHTNVTETTINTPNMTISCSNQNQSLSVISGLLGNNFTSGSNHPNYRCIASAPVGSSIASMNSSTLKYANAIISAIENNTYINATKISQTSYNGNSCTHISGYVSSNEIGLSALLGSLPGEGAIAIPNYTIHFEGPYSICMSVSSGQIYNFSLTQNVSISYPQGSTPNGLNLSINIYGNVISIGRPEPDAYISKPPYQLVNGTCTDGFATLMPEDYPSQGIPFYYSCNTVDMNYSGYLRMSLLPETDLLFAYPNRVNSSGESRVRIVGLACSPYNPDNSSVIIPPGAASFRKVNLTVARGEPVNLTFMCNAAWSPSNGEYYAYLYAQTLQNYTSGTNATIGLISSVSVLPTASGS